MHICRKCGKKKKNAEFWPSCRKPNGWTCKTCRTGNRKYKYKHVAANIPEKTLRHLYLEMKLSQLQIAKQYHCQQTSISRALKKFGIPIRTHDEQIKAFKEKHGYKKWLNDSGYVMIRIKGKAVREHRFIMEQILGRPLLKTEEVHHLNGDRTDNRPENLAVVKSHHGGWTLKKVSEARIRDLEAEKFYMKEVEVTRAHMPLASGEEVTVPLEHFNELGD
jgi:polyribonucleotide nucleotidyltransferase